jgi:BarA-like signal transduction histidine kinase
MKLKIFGVTVPVKDYPNLIHERGWAGFYDITEKVIYIDPAIKGAERMQTILHEFGHAVMYRTAMQQTKIPHEVFEIIVDNFATALTENFNIRPK